MGLRPLLLARRATAPSQGRSESSSKPLVARPDPPARRADEPTARYTAVTTPHAARQQSSVRRLFFHPLAAPILIALLFVDLWVQAPIPGYDGRSRIQSAVWPPPPTNPAPTATTYTVFKVLGGGARNYVEAHPPMDLWIFVGPSHGCDILGETRKLKLTYTTIDEARGLWALTRLHSVRLIQVFDGPDSITPEELPIARREFVRQEVAGRAPPAGWMTQLESADIVEDHILYTGYLHNTAALLMATWLPFASFGLFRFASGKVNRARRLRLGLCSACAYNLAGLPAGTPCPECGAPR